MLSWHHHQFSVSVVGCEKRSEIIHSSLLTLSHGLKCEAINGKMIFVEGENYFNGRSKENFMFTLKTSKKLSFEIKLVKFPMSKIWRKL